MISKGSQLKKGLIDRVEYKIHLGEVYLDTSNVKVDGQAVFVYNEAIKLTRALERAINELGERGMPLTDMLELLIDEGIDATLEINYDLQKTKNDEMKRPHARFKNIMCIDKDNMETTLINPDGSIHQTKEETLEAVKEN